MAALAAAVLPVVLADSAVLPVVVVEADSAALPAVVVEGPLAVACLPTLQIRSSSEMKCCGRCLRGFLLVVPPDFLPARTPLVAFRVVLPEAFPVALLEAVAEVLAVAAVRLQLVGLASA